MLCHIHGSTMALCDDSTAEGSGVHLMTRASRSMARSPLRWSVGKS